MKRFTFPLERLLRLRHQETEQAKLDLARALQHQAVMEAELERAAARFHQGLERAVANRVATAAEFAARRHHVGFLYQQTVAAADAKGEAEAATVERRHELLLNMQREQVLTKYRERRFAEYQVEVVREEQKFLDEISQAVKSLHQFGRQEVEG